MTSQNPAIRKAERLEVVVCLETKLGGKVYKAGVGDVWEEEEEEGERRWC